MQLAGICSNSSCFGHDSISTKYYKVRQDHQEAPCTTLPEVRSLGTAYPSCITDETVFGSISEIGQEILSTALTIHGELPPIKLSS